jgi:hypothetical protein
MLYIRADAKYEMRIFKPTEEREKLIDDIETSMGYCYSNIGFAKPDMQWDKYFEGLAKDVKRQMMVNAAMSLVSLPLMLIPPLQLSAGLMMQGFAYCGAPCVQALAAGADYFKEAKNVQFLVGEVAKAGIKWAAKTDSQAKQGVESATDVANFFQQIRADADAEIFASLPGLSNQALYAVLAQHNYTSGADTNCTVSGGAKLLKSFSENFLKMKEFGYHLSPDPLEPSDDFIGVCRKGDGGKWYYVTWYSERRNECYVNSYMDMFTDEVPADFVDVAKSLADVHYETCADHIDKDTCDMCRKKCYDGDLYSEI